MSAMTADLSTLVEELLGTAPFSMYDGEKRAYYSHALSALTLHHSKRCPEYRRIASLLGYRHGDKLEMEDVPFIPVRLFKEYELRSVERGEIVKTMTSSGTTGQAVSKIYLDRATATNQTKVLVKIVSSFTGSKRLPLLIIDSPSVIKDRALFSARGAGILGFSMLGYDPTYLLDENYRIDFARLDVFLEKHQGSRILLFGFTFVIWEYLCQALVQEGRNLQLDGIMIHGGGWKKLASLAVDNPTFKRVIAENCGVLSVCNYYGMVEQTGSIFMECEHGVLHSSIYSNVIVRDPVTFSPLGPGRVGLLQLVSLLPMSYPGHSILTEDLGEIIGVDDCPCGRKGRYFRVLGRVKNAEVRGCSDVHASYE
jgi:phenylacetate-coenzyme A ligase PaaK-like adenylate-forming protein